jgi:hypothetical protein
MFNPLEYAGKVRIPPAKMQVRMRREGQTMDAINARQFEAWQATVPVLQGGSITDATPLITPVSYDMAPQASRNDKRDYRQSQPFVADGPSLATNPYFDRYDPTRDPRNMIREIRNVVYEEKDADRGLEESKRLLQRGYMSRWMPEGSSDDDLKASLDAYEIMKPKKDDFSTEYRGYAGSGSGSGSRFVEEGRSALGSIDESVMRMVTGVPPPNRI